MRKILKEFSPGFPTMLVFFDRFTIFQPIGLYVFFVYFDMKCISNNGTYVSPNKHCIKAFNISMDGGLVEAKNFSLRLI